MPLIETYSDITGVFEYDSTYNPWKTDKSMNYYNFEEKGKRGEVTKFEMVTEDLKFSFIRSNVLIDNMSFIERVPDENAYNWFF